MPGTIVFSKYNIGVVRQLVGAAFGDQELQDFCMDYFYEVYKQFTQGQTKSERVRMLVDYADRKERLDELIDGVREKNPAKYREYERRLLKSETITSFEGPQPAGQPPAVAFAPIDQMRDDVERLRAYIDLFSEVLTTLEKLTKLADTVKQGLANSEQEWWKGTMARSYILAQLVPALDEVSTGLMRYTNLLEAKRPELRDEHRDEVLTKTATLRKAWEDAEKIKVSIGNDCDDLLLLADSSADAKKRIVKGMLDLDRLVMEEKDMQKSARDIAAKLYTGIKEMAELLAKRVGIEEGQGG